MNDARLPLPGRSLSVTQFAHRYTVSRSKVRYWLRTGQLRGVFVDCEACRRRVIRIPPEAVVEFEKGRSTAPPPKPPRKKRTTMVDFYPD